ncbi:hypothetical protein KVP10_08365 [Candidimonas humi]|uniref:Uncharacterized protein n=1 Tax=Candidimonas humi TaxID=683355 RepID=A0ABV8NXF3_9BURK|nr:hypothetical protein [Candidimonas humi]MBV6304899.1 hypothetical protein [Candidimonas humi]
MSSLHIPLADQGSVDLPFEKVAQVFLPRLLEYLKSRTAISNTPVGAPAIGQPWPEQGGIYLGPRIIDGSLRHRVFVEDQSKHPRGVTFDNVGNAVSLLGPINKLNDWAPADMEDVMLAFIHARQYFPKSGRESVYWTTKPYGSDLAWALDFEDGGCGGWGRHGELAVLPVRSITS